MTSDFISIGELARRTGLSTHTLRYYEAEGVLRPVARAANGHRRYAQADVPWLAFVLRLKRTEMPIRESRRDAELRTQGEASLPARLTMPQLHRERLATRMLELTTCAGTLDAKIHAPLATTVEAPPRSTACSRPRRCWRNAGSRRRADTHPAAMRQDFKLPARGPERRRHRARTACPPWGWKPGRCRARAWRRPGARGGRPAPPGRRRRPCARGRRTRLRRC